MAFSARQRRLLADKAYASGFVDKDKPAPRAEKAERAGLVGSSQPLGDASSLPPAAPEVLDERAPAVGLADEPEDDRP